MAKVSTNYVCQQCGATTPRWYGKCPQCGTWGSLVETIEERASAGKASPSEKRALGQKALAQVIPLHTIVKADINRQSTGIGEFDRVLGGGIVPGMAVLLAGEPGIGKSTLLLTLAASLANQGKGARGKVQGKNTSPTTNSQPPTTVLYVAGEESPQQIKIRAERLGFGDTPLAMLAQTNVDIITEVIEATKPGFVFIDSVQTLKTDDLSSTFGSVGQVRECVDRLTMQAKRLGIPIFFIGHVTKEGAIAGPKVLEHIVDTVLMLEGDASHAYRILRAAKNRFGSIDEVGVFSMEEEGLTEVSNPSQAFLQERLANAPGSVVVPTIEGTRTILIEVQALTSPTTLAMPRRVGIGVDYNRLQLLMAILAKVVHSELAKLDVFVNIAGGLKVAEPALDLGICLAIVSAFKSQALDPNLTAFGEVGLLGEVRTVRFAKQRASEAKRLGYDQVIGPENVRSLKEALAKALKK